MEGSDIREQALDDPRGFVAQFPYGAVLEEVLGCPDLLSYIQGIVDKDGRMGLFILTGSQQFGLRAGFSQSLAGRGGFVKHRSGRRLISVPISSAMFVSW